tara:strand:+ start:1193 stop:1540 length:348 start_codon:yes stop_codon:yes gene_type:complete
MELRIQMNKFLLASALMPIISSTALAAPYEPGEGNWFMPWHGYGHMMFGGLMMLAFWALLIVVILLLVRWLLGSTNHQLFPGLRRSSALHLLEERFARGEIDLGEFQERKRHLSA